MLAPTTAMVKNTLEHRDKQPEQNTNAHKGLEIEVSGGVVAQVGERIKLGDLAGSPYKRFSMTEDQVGISGISGAHVKHAGTHNEIRLLDTVEKNTVSTIPVSPKRTSVQTTSLHPQSPTGAGPTFIKNMSSPGNVTVVRDYQSTLYNNRS